jgi:tellurite resistance protein TehA-like permease
MMSRRVAAPSADLRHLSLRSFTPVMATGILSVGAEQQGIAPLWVGLLVAAIVAYAGLLGAQALRLGRDRRAVADELRSPSRAFGALALVAATEVIASRLAETSGSSAAAALGAFGALIAIGLLPAVATSVLRASPRQRVACVTGTWLLATVSLESIAVVAADVGKAWHSSALAGVSAAIWLAGLAVYLAVVSLLVRRIALQGVDRRLLAGDHWIAMGALAIAAVAAASAAAAFVSTASFAPEGNGVRWASVGLWVACCPVAVALLAAEVWLAVRGDLLGYRAERWATIFPLGMFAVAAGLVGSAERWGGVRATGHLAFWVALAVWTAVAGGSLRRLIRAGWPRGGRTPGSPMATETDDRAEPTSAAKRPSRFSVSRLTSEDSEVHGRLPRG